MPAAILVNVIRGETVESIHRGHWLAIDGDGNVIGTAGDPETVTFIRSAAKPFQALPLITSGAADTYGFSEEEIALACASHSGEARHVRIAQLMLERIELTESYLRCGTHLPFSEKEAERMQRAGEYPTQLHNNCSGKHAAMLATAKHLGSDLATYEALEHPVQQEILKLFALYSGVPENEIAIGIDGCAAPNFAVPLSAMALAMINLYSPPDTFAGEVQAAAKRIVSAMVSFPELIGGSTRLDTMLMQAANGRIISKVGADGVWSCGIIPIDERPNGAAIALKIEDGDDHRARPVTAVAILKQLGILAADALPELSPMLIKNWRGDVVGRVEAVSELR
ncbi:MAG: asparaginase [Blastocatellia bacterium]|nr:asparaginase [Blastocatellia bacterium]